VQPAERIESNRALARLRLLPGGAGATSAWGALAPSRANPVVLMHGFLGFRRFGPLPLAYFTDVEQALSRAGFQVFAPTVNPLHVVAQRAYQWFYGRAPLPGGLASAPRSFRPRPGRGHPPIAEIVLRTRRPVHLIAHSQGCLDARFLLSSNGMGLWRPFAAPEFPAELRGLRVRDCVSALCTVAGPHNGVRYAEGNPAGLWLMDTLAGPRFNRLVSWLSREGADGRAALREFGQDAMLAFNRRHPDPPGVRLYSVAGRTDPAQVTFFLRSFYQALSRDPRFEAEDSDGLVTLSSAKWPVRALADLPRGPCPPARHGAWRFLGVVWADHVEQIGLPFAYPRNAYFRHREFYLGLARLLAGELPADAGPCPDGSWAQACAS